MENSLTASATPVEECHACNVKISNDDFFCPNCGYPIKGTEKDQKYFILKKDMAAIDIASFNNRLKKAGNSLYYLAAVFVLSGMIFYFLKKNAPDALAVLITNLVLAFVFLALGGYSKKKPLACIVSGLCLYVIVLVLNAVNNPASIASGGIVKIIIIGYMIKGIKSAIEIEKLKKEYNIA